MPTMNDLLVQSGFELSKPVGVIVEAETMSGDFMPTESICGIVLDSLPDACRADYPDFNLEFCIAVYFENKQCEKLIVFELLHGAEVYRIEPTGLLIWDPMYHVYFGQTPDFFQHVAEVAKRLPR